jgi:hypothetical protein
MLDRAHSADLRDEGRWADWPGDRRAVMYHGSHIPLSKLPVPAGAVYGAETLMIIMGDLAATPAEEITQKLVSDVSRSPRQLS